VIADVIQDGTAPASPTVTEQVRRVVRRIERHQIRNVEIFDCDTARRRIPLTGDDFFPFSRERAHLNTPGLKKNIVWRLPLSRAPPGIRTNCERVHVALSAPKLTA